MFHEDEDFIQYQAPSLAGHGGDDTCCDDFAHDGLRGFGDRATAERSRQVLAVVPQVIAGQLSFSEVPAAIQPDVMAEIIARGYTVSDPTKRAPLPRAAGTGGGGGSIVPKIALAAIAIGAVYVVMNKRK